VAARSKHFSEHLHAVRSPGIESPATKRVVEETKLNLMSRVQQIAVARAEARAYRREYVALERVGGQDVADNSGSHK
jgi:hypothetical protein